MQPCFLQNRRPHGVVTASHRRVPLARCTRVASAATTGEASTSVPCSLVTVEELQRVARRRGLHMGVKDLGPFYRIVCRDGGEEGRIIGVSNGFVAPAFGLMHCDTIQIFTRGLKGKEAQRLRGGPLGLGMLLGAAVLAYGHERGCRTAEILAINDDDAWHERLVRYYSYFGFVPVCRVGGNGLADWPHMLVWGGEGTRMDADIEAVLRRWTPALRGSGSRGGGGGDEGGGEAPGRGGRAATGGGATDLEECATVP